MLRAVASRRPQTTCVLFLAAMIGVSACATGGGRSTATGAGVITATELQSLGNPTVYEAVQRSRPAWLNNLGGAFVNGLRTELADLRSMTSVGVVEIALLSSEEATARFGTRSLSSRYLHIVAR